MAEALPAMRQVFRLPQGRKSFGPFDGPASLPAPDADDEENSRNAIDAEARRQAARRKKLKKGLVIPLGSPELQMQLSDSLLR